MVGGGQVLVSIGLVGTLVMALKSTGPQVRHPTSLGLSFLTCETVPLIVPLSQNCYKECGG